MAKMPPPPVWARPQLPAPWLDWFTRMVRLFEDNAGILTGNGNEVITLNNFTVVKDGGNLKLTWTNSNEANTAWVQIFRSPTSDSGDATLLNSLAAGINAYHDPVGQGITYYYWIRSITKGGEVGSTVGPMSATTDSWADAVEGTIAVGAALPSSGMVEGDVFYLTTDNKIYRYDGSNWITSVDGSDLLATSVTADKISVASLDAITTTTGTLTVDSSGYIRGGQTAYATGTGFFLGYSGGAYKLSIGDTYNWLKWDGTSLSFSGQVNTDNRVVTYPTSPYVAYVLTGDLIEKEFSTSTTTKTKVASIKIAHSGTVSVMFCISTVGTTVYPELHKNGDTSTTLAYWSNSSYTFQMLYGSGSVTVAKGDTLELWVTKGTAGGIVLLHGFFIATQSVGASGDAKSLTDSGTYTAGTTYVVRYHDQLDYRVFVGATIDTYYRAIKQVRIIRSGTVRLSFSYWKTSAGTIAFQAALNGTMLSTQVTASTSRTTTTVSTSLTVKEGDVITLYCKASASTSLRAYSDMLLVQSSNYPDEGTLPSVGPLII